MNGPSINRRSGLRLGALLLAALLAGVLIRPAAAIGLDDYSDLNLRIMQRDLARSYLGSTGLQIPELEYYCDRLLAKIKTKRRLLITSSSNNTINAAAYWGDLIVVNAGMFAFADTEDELMGVISHEVAHLDLKHIKRLTNNLAAGTAASALVILAGALTQDPELGGALIAGFTGIQANKQIAAIRKYENEADNLAFTYLTTAKISPRGYIDLIRRLDVEQDQAIEYLLTHPLTSKRLASLKARNRQLSGPPAARSANLDFFLIREILRKRLRLHSLKPPPATADGQIASDFAAMLAGRDRVDALAAVRTHWLVAPVIATHLEARGQTTPAIALLAEALQANSDNWTLAIRLLRALAQDQRPDLAQELLAGFSEKIAVQPHVAFAVARFRLSVGDQLGYRHNLARAYYLDGRLDQAQNQVKRAQDIAAKQGNEKVGHVLAVLAKNIARLRGIALQ